MQIYLSPTDAAELRDFINLNRPSPAMEKVSQRLAAKLDADNDGDPVPVAYKATIRNRTRSIVHNLEEVHSFAPVTAADPVELCSHVFARAARAFHRLTGKLSDGCYSMAVTIHNGNQSRKRKGKS